MGEAAFHHGWWKAMQPLTSTGSQMSNSFIRATQIVHESVLSAQFRQDLLDDIDVWNLVGLIECKESKETGGSIGRQIVMIEFEDGSALEQMVEGLRGLMPPLSNEEIVQKWRLLPKDVTTAERMDEIEKLVLNLDQVKDIVPLSEALKGLSKDPIA